MSHLNKMQLDRMCIEASMRDTLENIDKVCEEKGPYTATLYDTLKNHYATYGGICYAIKLEEEKEATTKEDKPFTVTLSSVGSYALGQDVEKIAPNAEGDTFARTASLAEASLLCREFIKRNGLSAGQWSGGNVYVGKDYKIAYIRFNGAINVVTI